VTADDALVEFRLAASDAVVTLLMAASRSVSAAVLHELDPEGTSGVRLAHIPVIAALDPGGSRLVELAKGIGVTRQATAVLVRDLEAAGMVSSGPDPTDGRATLVSLTDAGAAFCRRAIKLMAIRERAIADEVGDADFAVLKSALRRLAALP